MTTRIAYDPEENVAVLYDSVTGVAFGRVFEHDDYLDAENFLEWLPHRTSLDARQLSPTELETLRREFADIRADERRPPGVPLRGEA